MSIVPVLPVVRKLVGDACCTIIQSFFSKVNAPAADRNDLVSSSKAWNGLSSVQAFDLTNVFSTQILSKLNLAGLLGKNFFSDATSKPPAPAPPPAGQARLSDVANQPAPTATKSSPTGT